MMKYETKDEKHLTVIKAFGLFLYAARYNRYIYEKRKITKKIKRTFTYCETDSKS